MVVFSTKANPTTRENIANVYGAKTLQALVTLDLKLEMKPMTPPTYSARSWTTEADSSSSEIVLQGHISRPVVGEGRSTPDRQMFFVNSRPCALPQVAKAINEVYKSYNVTQSPFIFANLKMDTNAYDVNVSPDKRTILLHDQTALLDALKTSLLELFEAHEQSVPQAVTPSIRKLPVFRPLSVVRSASTDIDREEQPEDVEEAAALENGTPSDITTQSSEAANNPRGMIREFVDRETESREKVDRNVLANLAAQKRRESLKTAEVAKNAMVSNNPNDILVDVSDEEATVPAVLANPKLPKPVQDFNARLGVRHSEIEVRKVSTSHVEDNSSVEDIVQPVFTTGKDLLQVNTTIDGEEPENILSVTATPQRSTAGIVQNAFDRMRAKRTPQETATVTIGNQTTVTTIGTPDYKKRRIHTPKFDLNGKKLSQPTPLFSRRLRAFAAPGTEVEDDLSQEEPNLDTIVGPSRARLQAKHVVPISSTVTPSTDDTDMLELDDEEDKSASRAAASASDNLSDDDYMDEEEKKIREEAKVAKMIAQAEETAARPSTENMKRATTVLRGKIRKDSTLQLVQTLKTSVTRIEATLANLTTSLQRFADNITRTGPEEALESTAEDQLSLTVSKADFARMNIIGQFNLGFILATRPAAADVPKSTTSETQQQQSMRPPSDELFIIDQHASDEKYNFERLQAETVVQNQRLVHPRLLELTAIEEELILNHQIALAKNGFIIETDTSGTAPVGQRCHLVSLPMSKEVVFDARDLEELLALLAEEEGGNSSFIPRPSKVRRMFAMRACRSSIMVGKNLTKVQMGKVVRHMGELDQPWNCPHGRPTMRHLYGVGTWEGWKEGDGLEGLGDLTRERTDWKSYVHRAREEGLVEDIQEAEEDAEE
jgi:DNA mismatch repair protein PMS2